MTKAKNNYGIYLTVFCFSLGLTILGKNYATEPGFILAKQNNGEYYYSTELMSSGGDDFDIFQTTTTLNKFLTIFVAVALILEQCIKKNLQVIIVQTFYSVYFLELFLIFLISLDISFLRPIYYGDKLLLLWFVLFFTEILCVRAFIFKEKQNKKGIK